MGSDLLVDYEKIGADIRIRFYVSGAAPVSETGGEIFGSDTIATVKAFPIMVFQEAILYKVKWQICIVHSVLMWDLVHLQNPAGVPVCQPYSPLRKIAVAYVSPVS